jgi:hypothetical protein
VITVADVRHITSALPRSYEVVVGDRIKFRVGRIVYLAFSRDETVMGFAFPKEERAALVAADPGKFTLPRPSEMRITGCTPGWTRSTSSKRARSSSKPGGCACRKVLQRRLIRLDRLE